MDTDPQPPAPADAPLDEAAIRRLVDAFYGRVRADPQLGPVFNGAVDDWPTHLETLTAFWSSVMLGSGRYKGNPLATHGQLGDRITPQLFERWLALWTATTAEVMAPEAAAALQAKAARIAESLQLGLFFKLEPQSPGSRPGRRERMPR